MQDKPAFSIAPQPPDSTPGSWRRRAGWAAIALVAAAVLADRWAWAMLAEWGGDQGIVVRLARAGSWSVGLLNSHGDPNPNGLTILGRVMVSIGDLRVGSLALSLAQALAVCWLACGLTRSRADAFLVAQPLLWCSSLRAVSTELWAQWLLITLGTISVAALLQHIRRPRVRFLVASWGSAWMSAAVYLPGVVSLGVVSVLWAKRLSALTREERRRHFLWGAMPVFLIFATVVFIPFLSAVNVSDLSPGTSRSLARRLAHAAVEPVRALPALLGSLQHTYPRTLRPAAEGLSRLDASIVVGAFVLAVLAAFQMRGRARPVDLGSTRFRYALAFLLGIFALTPVLTGYALSRDGRLDQALQAIPVMLALAFAGLLLLRVRGPIGNGAAVFSRLLAVIFAVSQAQAGVSVREAILAGRTITYNPDLSEVRAVADRLAEESGPAASPRALSIEYRSGVDWFAEYLQRHERWHNLKMTGGEVFDDELAFRAGVKNECAPDCPPTGPRYLVDWGPGPHGLPSGLIWTSSNGRIRIERLAVPSRAARLPGSGGDAPPGS